MTFQEISDKSLEVYFEVLLEGKPLDKLKVLLDCTQLLNSADFAAHKQSKGQKSCLSEIEWLEIQAFVHKVIQAVNQVP